MMPPILGCLCEWAAPGGYINEAEDPFDIDADSGFTIDTPSNAELLETKRRHNYEMRQAEAE